MTAKKRWTSLIHTESQELIEKISWNSSSSEESELEGNNPKKFKPFFPKFEMEMKLNVRNPFEIKKMKKEEHHEVNLSTDISTFDSDVNVIDLERKSPVLKPKTIALDPGIPKMGSPIMYQNYLFRETSPVLTNKDVIRRIKKKQRKLINRSTKIDGSSPDIFLSQKSRIIEDNDSPDKILVATTNCSQDLGSIELISSQDSSSLVIVNPSTSENSVQSSDMSNQCYHQPSLRKKHCKKNGVLLQLQKSLDIQKSRMSVWHHDIFCKNVITSNVEHIQGVINEKWKDFGCTILKCSKMYSESKEFFLISLGSNIDSNLVWRIGQILKIYPPFKEKVVQFENQEVTIFYNVFKISTEATNERVI